MPNQLLTRDRQIIEVALPYVGIHEVPGIGCHYECVGVSYWNKQIHLSLITDVRTGGLKPLVVEVNNTGVPLFDETTAGLARLTAVCTVLNSPQEYEMSKDYLMPPPYMAYVITYPLTQHQRNFDFKSFQKEQQ